MNILDLVGLENREDYFGPIMQLVPININKSNFDWRVMVQDFVGSEPYFIPMVDINGDPIKDENSESITYAQVVPYEVTKKETTPSFIEQFGTQGIGVKQ